MARQAKGFNENELKLVDSRLKRLSELPGSDMKRILSKVTEDMQRDVIAAAPYAKGNLKNSVYIKSSEKTARVWVDTTKTDKRRSSSKFNYGRTVEHGRVGQYKTTPYFYDVINRALGTLVKMINDKIRDNKINN